MGGMKRQTREIAKTLDAWVAKLRVVENGRRTDAEVKGVIRGIEKGNACSLEEILGMPVLHLRSKTERRGGIVDEEIAWAFAWRLARRLYPDGAATVEEVVLRATHTEVRFNVGLRLVYPQ